MRRVDTSSAVILNSWEGAIEPGLADYLLLPTKQPLPPAGRMGAILDEENDALKVAACLDNSPCATAGIKAGDRIMSIDNETINSMADLRLALWDKQPGDTISVDILRKRWFSTGKTRTYVMTLK
jgi:S1-C subfamily serine protease